MKNKKTVLIFANEKSGIFARAIKERLAPVKDILCIIIGEDEFRSTGMQIAKDILLNPDGLIIKTAKKLLEGSEERSIDKVPSPDITYKDRSVSYLKMRNVLSRYNPMLIIMMSGALSPEVLSVRAKFSPETKVFMLVKDFAIHCGIINPHIDKYFVENMAVLTMLTNAGVKEKKIAISNLPVSEVYDVFIEKQDACEKLELDPFIPVVLFCAYGKHTEQDKTALRELKEFASRCNVVAYCGGDRELLDYAMGIPFKAFNEGGDLNLLYSAADLVVTRPVSKTLIEAAYKQVLTVLLPPSSEMEKRSIKGLKGLAVDASAKGGLVTFLDDYLRTEGYEETYQSITEEATARLIRPAAGNFLDSILSALEIK